jgi:hypothetical protein
MRSSGSESGRGGRIFFFDLGFAICYFRDFPFFIFHLSFVIFHTI